MIRLGSPWSLLVVGLFAFVFLRLRTFSPGFGIRRGVAWLALAVALADPILALPGAPEPVAVLVDLSESAARAVPSAVRQLRDALARAPAGAEVAVLAFGATAASRTAERRRVRVGPVTRPARGRAGARAAGR